jgi:hypothetical protein
MGGQLSQLNARLSAQAEFGAQLTNLRDRITELQQGGDERRSAALAATGDADLRDRVNALGDRLAATEGLAATVALLQQRQAATDELSAQMAQLAERVSANDVNARATNEHVAALEQRLGAVGTELANQLSELGRDIDGLAAHTEEMSQGSVSDELITALRTGQIKLANEQARYEIAFRNDLAALAEHVRRNPTT